jgi:hypothetical protein
VARSGGGEGGGGELLHGQTPLYTHTHLGLMVVNTIQVGSPATLAQPQDHQEWGLWLPGTPHTPLGMVFGLAGLWPGHVAVLHTFLQIPPKEYV